MWALRRASVHLKNQGASSGTSRICYVKTQIASSYLENYNAGITEYQGKVLGELICSRRYNKSSLSESYTKKCTFSSQASARGSCVEHDDELISDSMLSDGESVTEDIQHELESSDESDDKTKAPSDMTKAIFAAPSLPVSKVLDKWVQEGNEVTRNEVWVTVRLLQRRRSFKKALELLFWLESAKQLEFTEKEYASCIDLIAKVHGINKAEKYLHQIPESLRGKRVYCSLLVNCVSAECTKKSEELFDKMKNLFPCSRHFSCNQMLLLYKKTDRRKISDVLSYMARENIEPSVSVYRVLVDVKGQAKDISGMEQIIEIMKSNGVKPGLDIQVSLAHYYAACGLKDKAEAILKEMEGHNTTKSRWVCQLLLPVYASLGRDDEVERIWKVCQSNPTLSECKAAIKAWGQLKRIEDAEAAFEQLLKCAKRPCPRHYVDLLSIYTNQNMLDKGKKLIERMLRKGISSLPVVWDAAVKFYARGGEMQKAESVLNNAIGLKKMKRPLVSSYLTILNEYAKRGDVQNAEKVFRRMRQVGYLLHVGIYRSLLNAYVNAKAPAHGFVERMKGDNVIVDKPMAALLAQADAIRMRAKAE